MDDTRLPKKCYLFQLTETQRGIPCWLSKVKLLLENLGLQEPWLSNLQGVRSFRSRCTEKLMSNERDKLRDRASQYESLKSLRVVKELVGRGAPIISAEVQANPDRHRWIVMTLLSCPGSLVKRYEGLTSCAVCAEPVSDVFTHLVAFCKKIPVKLRQKQNLKHLVDNLQSDPGSALPTMIHQLFLSGNRFRLQRDYVDFLCQIRPC